MAKTRNQIQIVMDVVRYANIMNDLVDVVSYHLRRKNAHNGELLCKDDGTPFTVEEGKEIIKKTIQIGNQYYWALDEFITKVGAIVIRDALEAWGVDAVALKTEIDTMKDEVRYVWDNVDSAASWDDLIPMADRLDANVPKLNLIRRRWCL